MPLAKKKGDTAIVLENLFSTENFEVISSTDLHKAKPFMAEARHVSRKGAKNTKKPKQ